MNQSPFIKEPKRIKKETFKPPPPNKEDIEKEVNVKKSINEDMHFDEEKKRLIEKPAPKVKALKPKRPLTEKQKAHLENMRLKRAEKQKAKLEKQMEKTDIVTKAEKKMEKPVEYTDEEIKEMEKAEFDQWIKHMDKFNRMVEAVEREKMRKLQEQQKKEAEIEARIRKKIEMENKQRNGQVPKKQGVPSQNLPPILQQQENEYGEYAHMFGF